MNVDSKVIGSILHGFVPKIQAALEHPARGWFKW